MFQTKFILRTVSASSFPFLQGGGEGNFHPQILKTRDQKKMSAWGDLKSSWHIYLPGGITMFLVKRRLLTIKYGFEGSISNVDLGLF